MDFYSDQHGIMNRYLREKSRWDIHLNNTKKFILTSCKDISGGNLVVLGSGWLLDFPMEKLSEKFDNIYLVDIVHPKQVKMKFKNNAKIHCVNADITGGIIQKAYKIAKNDKKHNQKLLLTAFDLFEYELPVKPDFVISLNILNQLNILIVDYLKKHKIYSDNELLMLAKKIQKMHLKILPKNKSCIIFDYEEELYNEDDALMGVKPLVFIDFPKGETERWQWKFDTKMTYNIDAKTLLNVAAINLEL
jgi:hypothetical protein